MQEQGDRKVAHDAVWMIHCDVSSHSNFSAWPKPWNTVQCQRFGLKLTQNKPAMRNKLAKLQGNIQVLQKCTTAKSPCSFESSACHTCSASLHSIYVLLHLGCYLQACYEEEKNCPSTCQHFEVDLWICTKHTAWEVFRGLDGCSITLRSSGIHKEAGPAAVSYMGSQPWLGAHA